MNAEFIAIGSELLLGDIINSNAAWVGKSLASIGVELQYQTVVSDDPQRIAEVLNVARSRSQAVIISGGLGPTEDDLTREAVSSALGKPLHRSEELAAWLRERFASFGRPMPERNLTQADVIEGARIIEATWGTAPGQILEDSGVFIALVPGVPAELQDMMQRAVLPELSKLAGQGRIVTRTLHVAGLGESAVAERLRSVWNSSGNVSMSYLAGRGEVRVRFTAKGSNEKEALQLISPLEAHARELLGDSIIGTDANDLDEIIAARFREKGWTLGAAESLTGGGFGERCTRLSGASEWFRGSLVTYATEVKTTVLGIPSELIEEHGVVSVEVARAMASAARQILEANFGVGLTGVAGPSDQGRNVGTVCIAVASETSVESRELVLPGDRARVRQLATSSALMLLERVSR
jgi:nicotinamide-nucleotide amidase